MRFVEITETHSWWDEDTDEYVVDSCETFVIDLEKIDRILAENSDEFWYTKFIIEAAREGKTQTTASRKYSFTDTDWEAHRAKPDTDYYEIDHHLSVELNY